MPTEDFLARLIKSKAAGASTVMPTIGVESGPEAVSKSLVSPSGVVDASVSEATAGKGKEKKRCRDGHSSKNPHSKKPKDSVSCPAPGGLFAHSGDDVVALSPRGVDVISSGSLVGSGLRGCKSLVDKLSVELERLLKFDDPVDVVEVKRLRNEVKGLKKLNKDLEETSKELANDNEVAANKLFAALTEKSELITECDSLGGQVKILQMENEAVKGAAKESEEKLVKGLDAWTIEKAGLMTKMEDLSAQLAKCQSESLSSFEEGYGECFKRFAMLGIDVTSHTFECYLEDVAKRGEAGKTGSSDAALKA